MYLGRLEHNPVDLLPALSLLLALVLALLLQLLYQVLQPPRLRLLAPLLVETHLLGAYQPTVRVLFPMPFLKAFAVCQQDLPQCLGMLTMDPSNSYPYPYRLEVLVLIWLPCLTVRSAHKWLDSRVTHWAHQDKVRHSSNN